MSDDTAVCPLCGNANECAAAAGTTGCWCATIAIPADVIARIPDEDRMRRCVCRRCAGASADTETSERPPAP
jgi:hypothetical protein